MLGKLPDFTVDYLNPLDGTSWQTQNFFVKLFERKPVHEDCTVFVPDTEECHLKNCSAHEGAVCLYKNGKFFNIFSNLL